MATIVVNQADERAISTPHSWYIFRFPNVGNNMQLFSYTVKDLFASLALMTIVCLHREPWRRQNVSTHLRRLKAFQFLIVPLHTPLHQHPAPCPSMPLDALLPLL